MAFSIERAAYADMFGPTVGDRVRLADTDLIIEVEADRTTYGEEVWYMLYYLYIPGVLQKILIMILFEV